MSNEYTSSIIKKYGDSEKVPQDCKTIFEIMNRQGTSLLIDCIAEHVGTTANRHNLNASERALLVRTLIQELTNALNERT